MARNGVIVASIMVAVVAAAAAREMPVVFGALSSPDSSDPDPDSENSPLPLTAKHDTAIVAAPDGTVYLVEIGSGKILWSFSSGPSIYSSFQQIPNHEGEKLNASADGDNFYIDCGEDWELYLHANGLKEVKLPVSAEEFVKRTPFVSAGGGVMLGSKKTAVFLVDAKTGKVVRSFRSDNLPSDGEHGADETSSLIRGDIEEWLPASSVDSEAIDKPLYVTRTDYALKYTSVKTGKVLWYLMFADIEASFQCEGIENFLGGFPHNNKFRPGQGLDMKLPMHCETRPVVYRIRDRSSLEPLFIANGLRDALPGGGVLSLPDSDLHSIEPMNNLLAPLYSNEKEMLALPTSNYEEFMIRSLPGSVTPQISSHVESDSRAQSHLWPSMLYSALVLIATTFFFCVRLVVVRRQGKLQKQSEDVKLQNVTPKKKKGRKSAVNRHSIIVQKSHEDNFQTAAEATHSFLKLSPSGNNYTSTDVRKIGKLIVTNKEIAKGSNGTVVLEGNYDGRSVAVKRVSVAIALVIRLVMHISALPVSFMDIVCGLAHLHELGIIHRDLKPQNVLVIKDRSISAKISDMGISKHLDGEMSSLTKHATGYGSSGWQAPEQLRHERQTRAVDLFSLGCILFFCISGGKHPFGENLERDVNIVNDRKDLFLIDHIPEATDLISRLLDPNPDLRPKAIEVMHHPLFWNSEKRLSFLRDASDRVELEDREDASQLLEALENSGRVALGGKWDEKMENAFINDIGRYRRYKFDSVRDLLRVIRNKLNHYRELPKEIQAILGSVPEGFDSYFSTRFPKLLIEVYRIFLGIVQRKKYFRSTSEVLVFNLDFAL
ncbi:hypothetical protein DH2020_027439 [Rehmannia glutinosa]|uniref:non-specific serine/threonine protein kinase n=1 Tax=Rehmannia glutinosa TaxID=99300 RepID=A0ABR0VU57_REHGL